MSFSQFVNIVFNTRLSSSSELKARLDQIQNVFSSAPFSEDGAPIY